MLLILVLALVIRVLLLIVAWRNDHAALALDSQSYLVPARNLAANGTFRDAAGRPEIFRTPGYPLFLVLCGLTGLLGYGVAQAVQVCLDVVVVFLTYLLGARLLSPAAGLWAAALHAVSMVAIVGTVQVLSDGLFSFLLIVAIVLLMRHFETGKFSLLLTAAAVTAAATYVRPVGFVLVTCVILVLFFGSQRRAHGLYFGVLFALFVAPWFVRNYLEVGYQGFSPVGRYILLYCEAGGVWARTHNVPIAEAQRQIEAFYHERLTARKIDPGSPQAIRLAGEIAREIILSRPLMFLEVHLLTSTGTLLPAASELTEALGMTTGGRGTLSVLQTGGPWAAAKYYFGTNAMAALLIIPELLVLAIQYFGCAKYVFERLSLRKLDPDPVAWLVFLTTLSFLLIAGPASVARYRMPVDPLLSAMAGAGLATTLKRPKVGTSNPGIKEASLA